MVLNICDEKKVETVYGYRYKGENYKTLKLAISHAGVNYQRYCEWKSRRVKEYGNNVDTSLDTYVEEKMLREQEDKVRLEIKKLLKGYKIPYVRYTKWKKEKYGETKGNSKALCEEFLKEFTKDWITYKGKKYRSVNSFLDSRGHKIMHYRYWVKQTGKDLSTEENIDEFLDYREEKLNSERVYSGEFYLKYKGEEYFSLKDLIESLGYDYISAYGGYVAVKKKYIRTESDVEDFINYRKSIDNKMTKVDYKGKEYTNVRELVKDLGGSMYYYRIWRKRGKYTKLDTIEAINDYKGYVRTKKGTQK